MPETSLETRRSGRPSGLSAAGHEREPLGAEVAGGGVRGAVDLGLDREVPVVDVLDERRPGRVGHVVDHDAADALEGDVGVEPAADLADRDGLGLGALGVAPRVERVLVVVGVEGARERRGRLALEVVARVEHLRQPGAGHLVDRERPAAKGDEPVLVAVAVGVAGRRADFEPAEPGVGLERGGVRERRRVEREALDPGLVAVAGVALVGRGDVDRPADLERRHGVGLAGAEHGDRPDVDAGVAVGRVDPVAGRAVVLEPEPVDARERPRGEVDDGERVGLLDRDVGRRAEHGDVLGLEVLGHAGRGGVEEDAAVELAVAAAARVEVGEPDRGHRRLAEVVGPEAGREVDHRDRPLGVHAAVRLALVGDDDVAAVVGEREPVGERADGDGAEEGAGGGDVEPDLAVVGLGLGLDGHGDDPVGDGDAVGAAAREADREGERGGGRVREVERLDLAGVGVDEEGPLGARVVGDDLGGPLVEETGLVGAQHLERRGRLGVGAGRQERDDGEEREAHVGRGEGPVPYGRHPPRL